MENPLYNSLTEQLIQNGILADDSKIEENSSAKSSNAAFNFFNQQEIETSKEDNDVEIEEVQNAQKNKKRLNRIEFEAENKIVNADESSNPIISDKKESFLIKYFPKLYKAYLAKNAMKELTSLNINTLELLDKTIPYGEQEFRYQNLIKYLKYANDIQIKINSKFR